MKRLRLVTKYTLARNLADVKTSPVVSPFLSSGFFIVNLITATLFLFGSTIFAQPTIEKKQETNYNKVVKERATKIVNNLNISDSHIFDKVVDEIAAHYIRINEIHEKNKECIATQKNQSLSAEELTVAIKKQEEKKSSCLLQQHAVFITQLKKYLTEEQLEKVKDGMTYRVLPITYAAYEDMLPNLTTEQKTKIYNWLKEARELAMDEGSSDDKHKMFGKYKGKINNYLSAAGYDMKKEGEEWQKRIKERKEKNKDSQ